MNLVNPYAESSPVATDDANCSCFGLIISASASDIPQYTFSESAVLSESLGSPVSQKISALPIFGTPVAIILGFVAPLSNFPRITCSTFDLPPEIWHPRA